MRVWCVRTASIIWGIAHTPVHALTSVHSDASLVHAHATSIIWRIAHAPVDALTSVHSDVSLVHS